MNPLLSFWIKVQPLGCSFGCHTWKAISQSSALAPSSGDDAVVSRSTTTYSWAFDHLRSSASRMISHVYWDIFCWATSSAAWPLEPAISRMHDAPTPSKPKPSSSTVLCEGYQRYPTRKVDATAVASARSLAKGNVAAVQKPTPLLRSQQLLQQQDYVDYQIQPNLVRRNSKEWVPEYKKERIDKINYNNVFGGLSDVSNNEIPTLPPPPIEDGVSSVSSSIISSRDQNAPKFSLIQPDSPVSSASTTTTTSPEVVRSLSLPSTPEPLDVSRKTANIDGPAPDDVICGRGGKANTHPGNISFREEAKKLRSWYESSSKSEKFAISSFLVDIVRERGGRFLKRDPAQSGGWSEADRDDVRKKASQALREGRRMGS